MHAEQGRSRTPGPILWQDGVMLAVSWDTVRLFLHVLAARAPGPLLGRAALRRADGRDFAYRVPARA